MNSQCSDDFFFPVHKVHCSSAVTTRSSLNCHWRRCSDNDILTHNPRRGNQDTEFKLSAPVIRNLFNTRGGRMNRKECRCDALKMFVLKTFVLRIPFRSWTHSPLDSEKKTLHINSSSAAHT